MKRFGSATQRKGEKGEILACLYLKRLGFNIIERNYTRKWGEIDIVAQKDGVTHFIEVKSVSRESGIIAPEENMHAEAPPDGENGFRISGGKEHGMAMRPLCVELDDVCRKARFRPYWDLVL